MRGSYPYRRSRSSYSLGNSYSSKKRYQPTRYKRLSKRSVQYSDSGSDSDDLSIDPSDQVMRKTSSSEFDVKQYLGRAEDSEGSSGSDSETHGHNTRSDSESGDDLNPIIDSSTPPSTPISTGKSGRKLCDKVEDVKGKEPSSEALTDDEDLTGDADSDSISDDEPFVILEPGDCMFNFSDLVRIAIMMFPDMVSQQLVLFKLSFHCYVFNTDLMTLDQLRKFPDYSDFDLKNHQVYPAITKLTNNIRVCYQNPFSGLIYVFDTLRSTDHYFSGPSLKSIAEADSNPTTPEVERIKLDDVISFTVTSSPIKTLSPVLVNHYDLSAQLHE